METLEQRQVLATFTFNMPAGNGLDDVTLRYASSSNRYEIIDTITQQLLAFKRTNGVQAIVINGASDASVAEPDRLTIDPTFFARPVRTTFHGGSSGLQGLDTIITQADANMVLTSGALQVGNSNHLFLTGVEQAELAGGNGNNILDAANFRGATPPGAPVTVGGVTLRGGAGDDRLIGGPGNDLLEGNSGDDQLLSISGGNDALDGGNDDDQYVVDPRGSLLVSDPAGVDTIDLSPGMHGVSVSTFDDHASVTVPDTSAQLSVSGSIESWTLTNYDDSIVIHNQTKDITVFGLAGDDEYVEQGGDITANLIDSSGDDSYAPGGSTITVTDNLGGDSIDFGLLMQRPGSGGATASRRSSGALDLRPICPVAGVCVESSDSLTSATSGDGDLVFSFSGAAETIIGSPLADVFAINPMETDQWYDGGEGDDTYQENAGDVTINISDPFGNETYDIGGSTVVVSDNNGSDAINFGMQGGRPSRRLPHQNPPPSTQLRGSCAVSGLCITVSDTGATATNGSGSLSFEYNGQVEAVTATDLNDLMNLTNTAGTSVIARALAGNDVIISEWGNDILDGGLGSDLMIGGTGNHLYLEMPDGADVIQDAGGIDTIDFSSARSGISFNLSLDNGGTQGLDGRGNTLRVYGQLENVLGSMFHDDLSGNNADNFISGLAGDDKIGGASGRDLLIGGTGRDQIQGNSGEDLLIAGSTLHELNDRGLRAILAEWTSPLTLATRVAHLRGTMPGGLNQGYLLNSGTVSDDGVPDIMHGSNGPDWLFFNPDEGDLVPDLDPNEDVINDDPVPMRPVGGIPSQDIVPAERVFSWLAILRTEGCSTDLETGLGAEIGTDTLARFTQKAV